MINVIYITAFGLLTFFLFVSEGFGENTVWGWSGGIEIEGVYHSGAYDVDKVETFDGTVKDIVRESAVTGMGYNIHIILATANGDVNVVLAPDWFLDKQSPKIGKNDEVEVMGSKMMVNDQPVIIASQVTRDGKVLQLRDEFGKPYWNEWRKGEMLFYDPEKLFEF